MSRLTYRRAQMLRISLKSWKRFAPRGQIYRKNPIFWRFRGTIIPHFCLINVKIGMIRSSVPNLTLSVQRVAAAWRKIHFWKRNTGMLPCGQSSGWPLTTLRTMWNSLTFPWRFSALLRGTRHLKCYSYHVRTSRPTKYLYGHFTQICSLQWTVLENFSLTRFFPRHSLTFSKIRDTSLTAVKFPDISKISRFSDKWSPWILPVTKLSNYLIKH